MTLDELLPQKLAEWRFHSERRTLNEADPEAGWAVELTADCADAVGCRLWEVALRPTKVQAEIDLRARADRVAARVTGLLEPLELIEVDALRRTAQLRSAKPAERGGDLHYYEILLDGNGAATVRRFQASRAGTPPRQQQSFTLTHDGIIKLVHDLAE